MLDAFSISFYFWFFGGGTNLGREQVLGSMVAFFIRYGAVRLFYDGPDRK